MSEFMVKFLNLQSDTEIIKQFSSDLNSYAEEIREIGRTISYSNVAIFIVKGKLYNLSTSVSKQSRKLINMSSSLEKISALYKNTENTIAESVAKSPVYSTETGDQPIFDDENNGYGGDQGNLASEHNGLKLPWGWVWFEDKDIYEFVRQREGYENYSEAQIHDLLTRMNVEGCGFIGIVNAIFSEFEGSDEEFEERFGFPMRDENGNYNYNLMFIDLYCQTDNKYYLSEDGGVTALAIEMVCSYESRQDEFREKYGVDLGSYDQNGNFNYNDDAILAVINEINVNHDSNDVVTFDDSRDGLTPSAQENHIKAYLKAHGMDTNNISYEAKSSMSNSAIQNSLNEGKVTSVLVLEGTEMRDDSGNVSTLGGGHYVTITGITDDGRYIVSSWGGKYYIDPSQASIANYQVINISF